jgi:hypothetical protein
MNFDRAKFKALVHYVCWSRKDDPAKLLGATKLNKILWLSDFLTYYRTGDPITGARYVKREFGPVPRAIVPVLDELEREGAVFARKTTLHGRPKTDFIVAKEPTVEFTKEELRTIDGMITFVCDEHTAKSISEKSHDHIWHAAEDGEDIPYFTVFAIPGDIADSDREWAQQEIESIETR